MYCMEVYLSPLSVCETNTRGKRSGQRNAKACERAGLTRPKMDDRSQQERLGPQQCRKVTGVARHAAKNSPNSGQNRKRTVALAETVGAVGQECTRPDPGA